MTPQQTPTAPPIPRCQSKLHPLVSSLHAKANRNLPHQYPTIF